MDIKAIRQEINSIDALLAEQAARRLQLMEGVAAYKKSRGLPLVDSAREQEVILRNAALFPEALRPLGEKFFRQLMELCKEHQKEFFPKKSPIPAQGLVGFQGVQGSFSHEALEEYFGKEAPSKNYLLFEDLTQALAEGGVQYAVLPIENSSTGAISEVYDLLLKYKLHIVGEKILSIRHNLLGVKGAPKEGISQVYSHIQGLRQCSQFLRDHPNIEAVEAANTAAAAQMIAEKGNPSLGAIASSRAGEIYGLENLAPHIHNSSGNSTRFIIAARKAQQGASDKISACFTLAHKPGALFSALKILEEFSLNMTKLESRPLPGCPWEYVFYLDFETSGSSPKEALHKLQSFTSSFVFLGAYLSDRGNT